MAILGSDDKTIYMGYSYMRAVSFVWAGLMLLGLLSPDLDFPQEPSGHELAIYIVKRIILLIGALVVLLPPRWTMNQYLYYPRLAFHSVLAVWLAYSASYGFLRFFRGDMDPAGIPVMLLFLAGAISLPGSLITYRIRQYKS